MHNNTASFELKGGPLAGVFERLKSNCTQWSSSPNEDGKTHVYIRDGNEFKFSETVDASGLEVAE